tara:strand:- start:18786 stop:19010 length:225 start_codon:yes stop_codon:yes gene_type:complete
MPLSTSCSWSAAIEKIDTSPIDGAGDLLACLGANLPASQEAIHGGLARFRMLGQICCGPAEKGHGGSKIIRVQV